MRNHVPFIDRGFLFCDAILSAVCGYQHFRGMLVNTYKTTQSVILFALVIKYV
jgi:hypothetical protein